MSATCLPEDFTERQAAKLLACLSASGQIFFRKDVLSNSLPTDRLNSSRQLPQMLGSEFGDLPPSTSLPGARTPTFRHHAAGKPFAGGRIALQRRSLNRRTNGSIGLGAQICRAQGFVQAFSCSSSMQNLGSPTLLRYSSQFSPR